MSIVKDQVEGTDLFRQLSREGYYITTIQRSKYLPRLEALYLRSKNNLANPTLPNGEEVVCYYHCSLPQLLQNYLYQQGKDSESFFMMEPAIRSSIEAPVEKIEKQTTLPDPESICPQELLICYLDQLIIRMEEDLSFKLYRKVVENLTALEDLAEFPNGLVPHANIADLLLFLWDRPSWYGLPCPVVAVVPSPHHLSIHGLKALDGTYICHPALERIPIIPIGTDKEGPSFVLSRHAIEIIYHDNIEICFKRLENYTGAEYVVTARLHYYASINPLLITGVANTQEALRRMAA
jgi:hypothetical protein